MRLNVLKITGHPVNLKGKKDAVVRYTLSKENKQIFASRYKLYLPTEKELREELVRERKYLQIVNDNVKT